VPLFKEVGSMYAAGDLETLVKFHKERDVLAELGRGFEEFTETGLSG
jgi:hypothetical protein